MYVEKFVAVLKVDGNILREDENIVKLPFGSQYSILLKNLNSVDAVASISIDGKDILDGNKVIVPANDSVEIERFVESLTSGNKLKFIQKTKEIVEYKGDNVDDGFLRISYRYVCQPETYIYHSYPLPYYYPSNIGGSVFQGGNFTCDTTVTSASCGGFMSGDSLTRSFNTSDISLSPQSCNYYSASLDSFCPSTPKADEGLTVKGAESTQQFKVGSTGKLEKEEHIIILRLKGYKDNHEKISKPLLVNEKITCSTCGIRNVSSNKFCNQCGTFLE